MLRAFVEVYRATMGPKRLAAKLTAYARLHRCVPAPPPGARHRPAIQEPAKEDWRRRYPLFPRLLFILDGTGPAGVETRIHALHAAARDVTLADFLREVLVLAAPMTDLLQHGPAAPTMNPTTAGHRLAGCVRELLCRRLSAGSRQGRAAAGRRHAIGRGLRGGADAVYYAHGRIPPVAHR
ncbi:hypothetical protein [Streptomyces griseicoloratus]|uniref:hypothetical protein n=1 Tax=Streptomyces griseicoloratus TaxID=2752516 RepID=UPI002795EC3C|nr:hypothetical protein [Streptomyces griseicoloratus]